MTWGPSGSVSKVRWKYCGGVVDGGRLGLVGGAPAGETPCVADSLAAGAGRVFHGAYVPCKNGRQIPNTSSGFC